MQQRISRVLAGACVVAGVGLIAASPAQAALRTGGLTCPIVKYGDLFGSSSGTGSATLTHLTSNTYYVIGFANGSTFQTTNISGWAAGGSSTFRVETTGTIASAYIQCNY